jgi:hypothetical protein
MNDAFMRTSESLMRTNPSLVRIIDTFMRTTQLTRRQSSSPVMRTMDTFIRTNASFMRISQLTSLQSPAAGSEEPASPTRSKPITAPERGTRGRGVPLDQANQPQVSP